MIRRRAVLAAGMAAAAGAASWQHANAANTPGVTATELKIGHTNPYSGPASAYSSLGKLERAYFNQMVNEQGGVAGRKVNFISLDDGYSPPRTVEDIRQLVEEDQVAFTFNTLGTPTNSAIERYMNQHKVPMLYVATGADKWGNYKQFPWTIGWQPSYRTEAQIYTKYMLKEKPNAKMAILYQNDDFGKDYPAGVKDILGDRYSKMVTEATYEVTDPTVDSQISSLQASGAEVLLVVATPKFAAQAIRKVHDLNWKPMFFMTNVSISVGSVITPAGPQNCIGMISAAYLKDYTDPGFKDDAGMKQWVAFMDKYLPGADKTDGGYIAAYAVSDTMLKVLKQCKGDLSRQNIMKQATNFHDDNNPLLLPGISISISPTNYHPIKAMQLEKWNGKTFERFGEVIAGA
ncbi:MAG TPA: ABC transporter substrate-binding protein [Acetobacteraceae bacterium]|nr:ABC transporter substrate-binding protein [Acetobacteraceae bacterium]